MAKKRTPRAAVQSGRIVMSGATGRWAGERLAAAMAAGGDINPSILRTLDTLRKDEWKAIDEVLIEEGIIRLKGIADLQAAGLVIPVANAMGKTLFQWENVTDMNPADTTMSGMAKTEDDAVDFALSGVPLPITHKDFTINMRTLAASRGRGESLDTTQARVAGRLVSEQLEKMLFQGGKTFLGNPIYGYMTHQHRNTATFSSATWSNVAVTGADILKDVFAMITKLEGDRFYGPYWLYVPSAYSTKLSDDFKAASDKTIRQRLLEVDQIQRITVVDQLTADNVIMVQPTKDVVALVNGEPLQSIQWDIEGGFKVVFKAFAIQVPLIRADAQNRCGVCHLSA